MFTKLIREIQVAARIGGGDPEANPKLRTLVLNAKSMNMPKENIEKAIKKGTGELEGVNYEEKKYEGYGPGGVAILVETLTDNPNRTTSEVRHIFSKYGGNLGTSGSVAWMFENKGVIVLDANKYKEEEIFEMVIDANIDNIEKQEDSLVITVPLENFNQAREILEKNKIEMISADTEYIIKTKADVDNETIEKVAKLVEKLEELDDVQDVYANVDLPE